MAYEPTLDDVLNSLYGPEGGLTEEELAQYMPEPYVAPQRANVPQGGGYAPVARGEAKLGGPRTPYDELIYQKAVAAGQDPNLIKAQIWAESSFNPKAVSHAGAQGLTQFMPGTWNKYGRGSPFDPNSAIDAQIAYNADLLQRFGGDERKVLAAYNWGEHRKSYALPDWERHAPAETRDYVQKILAKREQYAGAANRSYPVAAQEQAQPQESPFDIVKLSDGTSVDVAKGSSLADLAAALKANGIDAEPLKQVALPDGSYVDAPFSYADEQVLEGMKQHAPDAFGEQPEEASNRGYGAAAKSSFEAGIGSALTGLGGLGAYAGEKLESPLARQAGEYLTGKGKEWQKMGEEAYQELTPEEAKAMGIEGQFRKYVGEPVAGFVGSMGAALPALALPGGAATRIGAFAAQELGGQLAEQERMGQAPDVEKALPYAVGSGIVQNSLLGPLKYVTKAFGKPDVLAKIAEITEKEGADAAKQYAGGMMKNILKETGINTGEVVISEVISRAAERAASGQALDTPDALAEYEDIAIKSAPGGLLGIPGAFGVHAAKQGTIEEVELAKRQEDQAARIAAERQDAEEAAAVEVQKQAEADAELERQAGIGVPDPTIRGQENVAPTEPPLAVEEQLPPVAPVSANPPVAPEMGAVEVQAAPETDEIPEPFVRGREPGVPEVTNPADILGLNNRSGLRRQLRGLDVNKAEDHPKIDAILYKTSAAFPAEGEAALRTKMEEVQSANGIQKPAEIDAGSIAQPEIRQEGRDQTISSQGVRSSGQESGAVKVPEIQEIETVDRPDYWRENPEAPKDKASWQDTFGAIHHDTDYALPSGTKIVGVVNSGQGGSIALRMKTPEGKEKFWSMSPDNTGAMRWRSSIGGEPVTEPALRKNLGDSLYEKLYTLDGTKVDSAKSFNKVADRVVNAVRKVEPLQSTKVVDEQGKPKPMYHGTGDIIEAFDKEGLGTHFTSDPEIASKFAESFDEGSNVHKVFLDIKNPLRVKDFGGSHSNATEVAKDFVKQGILPKNYVNDAFYDRIMEGVQGEEATNIYESNNAKELSRIRKTLEDQGYDGLVYDNRVEGGGDTYVAFKPEQVVQSNEIPKAQEVKAPVSVEKPKDVLAERITAVQGTLREVNDLIKTEQAKPKPNPALLAQYKTRQRAAEQVFGNLKKQQSQQIQAKDVQRRVEAEQTAEIARAEAARKVQEQGGFEEDLIAAEKAAKRAERVEAPTLAKPVREKIREVPTEEDLIKRIEEMQGKKQERLLAKGETPKEIEIEGVKRPTTDSTGAPIHTTEEGVKNFWKGFKDSKVVDEKGRPLRVYHTTAADFSEFDTTRRAIGGEGSWFSSTPGKGYGDTGENIMPVYLALKNPKVIGERDPSDVLKKHFIEQGHDGVVMMRDGKVIQAVAFYPTQIKSAIGNKGAFDVSKPDIRESKGEVGVANPHTKETINQELKKLYGENAPQIEVSDRATEKTDAATKGFFEPSTGRAVLVADNIGRGENLHGLLRHEVAVHAKKLGKSDKEFQGILKQVDNLKAQGAKDVAEAFDRVPKDTKAEDVTHEALAYLVQHKPDLPVVKRFMSWLRRTANRLTGNAKWLKGDDFTVMADAVLKKAAKETKTEMKTGKAEERQYSKAPLVKETEAESSLKRGAKEAINAFKGNTWTKLETNYVNRHAALADAIKDKSTIDSNGKYRADLIGSANDQIFNVISAGTTDGVPVYSNAGTVMIQKNDKYSPDSIAKSIDKIKEKDPRPYVGFIFRALRGEELKKKDVEALKTIDTLEEKAKKLKALAKTQSFAEGKKADTLANRYLAEANKLKKRVGEEGREKLVSDEDILEAKRRLAKHPEIQDILDNVRGLMNSLVDLAVESGWVSKEVGKEWKASPYYFPLYMSQEDILSDPSKVVRAMGGGAKSLPNVKALKGGMHAINMLENLYKHYAFMISASAQNSYRKAAARDLELFGAAERTSPDDKNAIMFKEDGKEIYYKIADPLMFEAFQAAAPLTNPLLKAAREYTKAFRAVTLVNPLYWYRQLIRDPIHANVVSQTGMVTPIGATISFAKIIAGASPEYAELRRRGVVGAVDSLSDPARFKKIYDKGPNLFKKGADWVMHVHEAADAATRVEVYKAAAKEAKKRGMSKEQAKDYATMRAREIINFANQGRSETLQAIRATVPFFSAALNSLDSVARAATGKGLNRREAAEARRLFTSRMLMIASFTTAYALAMQDDEDYLKSPDSINNWLWPTGDKNEPFKLISLPFELGFFAKVLPEYIVRLNSGTLTPYEGKKMLKEAASATLTPPLPLPQVIKPIVEVMLNYDLHTGRPIVSPSEAGKLPEEQTKGASALSIEIGRKLGLSPAMVEHFSRGYLSELFTVVSIAAEQFLPAGQKREERYPGEIPILAGGSKGISSVPGRDRDMDIFYELSNGAQQIKRSVSAAQGKGDVDAMERIMADPEKKKRFYASDVGRNIGDEISDVNKSIEQIRNDKSITDPKKKQEMIREKQQYKNQLATQGKEWFYSLGVNEP